MNSEIESIQFAVFEPSISQRMQAECAKHPDSAHDYLHIQRVVASARKLAYAEGASLSVVLPAAYLHDLVLVPKNDPRRTIASQLSADAAVLFLRSLNYPESDLEQVHHAIHAHSFSAKIKAKTIEAQVVQDADRLEGLGAIGIARCFSIGGLLARQFYQLEDPFCEHRSYDDSVFTLDHFYAKLLKVPEMMQTSSGKAEGQKRLKAMEGFLEQLRSELL